MSNENVARLIKAYYPVTSINTQSIKFLDGSNDHNYYVKGSRMDCDIVNEFLFKVMVENDSNHFDAMTKLMFHLKKEGINVPLPVMSVNTNEYTVPLKKSLIVEQEVEDVDYTGLLLTYLPGNILSSVQRSPKLLYNIGEFVGKLNSVLQVCIYTIYACTHASNVCNMHSVVVTCVWYI